MKAKFYKSPMHGFGWFWEIKVSEYTSLTGYAYTRRGAEWEARREFKKYNKPYKGYEVDL